MIGQSSAADDFLVAGGILQPQLDETEEAAVILGRIDKLAFFFTKDMFEGNTEGGFRLIRRAHKNAHEDHQTGALHLGTKITERRLRPRNAVMIARMLEVVSVIQELLLHGKRISQRELYYLCIDSFDNQQQLNQAVLDVSAMLAVPRYALNIGAATRGVVAGCLRVATCGSVYHVDCKHVGTNGWPIPGDVREATSVVVASSARYILVIEKFGIFSRLVQDRIYDRLPCILVCGKGYPSVATRAMTCLLAERLRLPVLGLADFNPHGLALLQCYRRGSIRSSIEGSGFVCNLKWLGLRSSHIAKHSYIGYDGEPLTDRDRSILDGLQRNTRLIRESSHYMEEVQAMKRLGKYELQWLYGHASGANYLEHFVLESILCADYI